MFCVFFICFICTPSRYMNYRAFHTLPFYIQSERVRSVQNITEQDGRNRIPCRMFRETKGLIQFFTFPTLKVLWRPRRHGWPQQIEMLHFMRTASRELICRTNGPWCRVYGGKLNRFLISNQVSSTHGQEMARARIDPFLVEYRLEESHRQTKRRSLRGIVPVFLLIYVFVPLSVLWGQSDSGALWRKVTIFVS